MARHGGTRAGGRDISLYLPCISLYLPISPQADEADESGAVPPPLVLMAGLLGHEWDEDVDNGWRPAGLQRLSETTVDNVQVIQDYGATFDSGTATHTLVLHRRAAPSNALVFGAGTVQWSWGLDNQHDVNDPQRTNKYSIRVHEHPQGPCRDVQKLTLNVLADQGVLPSTVCTLTRTWNPNPIPTPTPTPAPAPTLTNSSRRSLRPMRATWPPRMTSARPRRMTCPAPSTRARG